MMEHEATDQPPTDQPKDTAAPQILVSNGSMAPQSMSELRLKLAMIAKGGGFPECFDNEAKRLAAYNLAHSLEGNKFQLALNHMAFIKGKLSIYGEYPGALAERTKEVQEKHVYLIDKGYKKICVENANLDAEPYAGVCIIQRKGRERKEFTYTIEQAKTAGQYPAKRRDGSINLDSPWMKFTGTMLMRKAMALGLKFEFADALLGIPIAEYDYDQAPDLVKDVTPTASTVESARERIRQAKQSQGEKNG